MLKEERAKVRAYKSLKPPQMQKGKSNMRILKLNLNTSAERFPFESLHIPTLTMVYLTFGIWTQAEDDLLQQ